MVRFAKSMRAGVPEFKWESVWLVIVASADFPSLLRIAQGVTDEDFPSFFFENAFAGFCFRIAGGVPSNGQKFTFKFSPKTE